MTVLIKVSLPSVIFSTTKNHISIPLKKPLKYYLKLQVPDVCEDNMLLIGLAELKKA